MRSSNRKKTKTEQYKKLPPYTVFAVYGGFALPAASEKAPQLWLSASFARRRAMARPGASTASP